MNVPGFSENDLWILLRATVVLVLSGALGWERERHRRAAGLRTHMLVGLSSTLFVSLGKPLLDAHQTEMSGSTGYWPASDPLRLIEAVVSGISFLGAGSIFVSRRRDTVQGLTTAASILATSAIGIAVGIDRFALALAVTVVVLGVLALLRHVEGEPPGVTANGTLAARAVVTVHPSSRIATCSGHEAPRNAGPPPAMAIPVGDSQGL